MFKFQKKTVRQLKITGVKSFHRVFLTDVMKFAVKAIFSGMKFLDNLGCDEKNTLEICYYIKKAEEIIYKKTNQNLSLVPKSDKFLLVEAVFRLVYVFNQTDGNPEWKVDAFKIVEFNIKHRNSLNEIVLLNY